ncbi:hypothetical protein JNB62_05465 [Microbacterium jejuense]|uniref:Helix-turn-helix domain-containing protein n=1 Tax=Microbacterium jejuense TaxID=1263637 RepID=A0ABS7HJK2_9MICO|nr:hypothetical protein [Microbacterium jejuense]MBW9093124.1 hypothetical protein [Microbacterium jejuense]
MTMLTYRQAATRVRRSIKTIKRWRRNGMPMGWELQHGQRVRVVDEEVLLGWFRGRLLADPVHQARLKATRVSLGVEIIPERSE